MRLRRLLALLATPLALLGACRGSPTPLPPPPVAAFGNEYAALDDNPWEPGVTSYGGVGVAPGDHPASTGFGGTTYVSPGGTPAGAPSRVADEAFVTEAPPEVFAGPGTEYAAPEPAAPAPPYASPGATVTTQRVPAFEQRPWRWHTSFAAAQEDARAQGKLILVVASNPGCHLCEEFRASVVPARLREVASVAVGYTYMASTAERPDVHRFVYDHLPGASLMPLVAFVDAELGWLHGFWGKRSPAQLSADVAQVRGFAPRVHTPWVEVPVAGPTPIAPTPSETTPAAPWPGEVVAPSPAPDTTVAPDPTWPAPVASRGPGSPGDAPPGGSTTSGMPSDPPGFDPTPPPVAPGALLPTSLAGADAGPTLPAALSAEAGPWGREQLLAAYAQIRGKRYPAAQETLRSIAERLPDTSAAREAAKGGVAIYNAKRMDQATSASERERYRERAARDLAGTIWSPLFDS
ncbi:MAG: hypothetical protein AB7T63_02640 [Planctomycetota bacterium]